MSGSKGVTVTFAPRSPAWLKAHKNSDVPAFAAESHTKGSEPEQKLPTFLPVCSETENGARWVALGKGSKGKQQHEIFATQQLPTDRQIFPIF